MPSLPALPFQALKTSKWKLCNFDRPTLAVLGCCCCPLASLPQVLPPGQAQAQAADAWLCNAHTHIPNISLKQLRLQKGRTMAMPMLQKNLQTPSCITATLFIDDFPTVCSLGCTTRSQACRGCCRFSVSIVGKRLRIDRAVLGVFGAQNLATSNGSLEMRRLTEVMLSMTLRMLGLISNCGVACAA